MDSRHKTQRLSDAQRHELETLRITTRDVRIYRRIQVIMLKDAGESEEDIRMYTGYSPRAQWWWLARYAEKGQKGLEDRPRSGRPCRPLLLTSTRNVPESSRSSSVSHRLGYWERRTLEEMRGHHPKRYLRDRAHMVLLREKQYPIARIADILGVRIRTVRTVLATYDREKLGGLYRKPGSGRISQLTKDQWAQIPHWLTDGPHKLGYRFARWTTRSLRAYLFKRFKVWFSREWIRQKLHDVMRFSWTKGKKVYAYHNRREWLAARQAFCRQMLQLLERAVNGEIILLVEDETILTLAGILGYSWSPVGTTQEVPTLGKRGRVVVFGATNLVSGRTHYRHEGTINQHSTLRFLKQLVRYYQKQAPDKDIVFVLDKHAGHTAYIIAELLAENEHLGILTTPTKSPDLNPQEHLWNWLDDQMIKNEFFEEEQEIKKAVRHFFSYIAGLKDEVLHRLGDLQALYASEVEKAMTI